MIIKLDKIDSTNRYALTEFANLADNSLVIADCQNAGRGRRGKSWFSPPGVNIYASYVIKDAQFPFYVSLWICGLASLRTLRETAPGINLWLKWPNDIYCSPKHCPQAKLKMAGMLAETYSPAASNIISGIVAGIGINLNMLQADIEKIDRPATSLLLETGLKVNIVYFAEKLLENLQYYRQLAEKQGDQFFAEWQQENRLLGQDVSLRQDNGELISGKVTGFSSRGEMIIRDNTGGSHNIMTGELEKF